MSITPTVCCCTTLGNYKSKFGENYTVLLTTRFVLVALMRWNLNRFLQFFYCWKRRKL